MTQDIDVAIIISDNRTKKKTLQTAICKVDTIDKFFWAFQSLLCDIGMIQQNFAKSQHFLNKQAQRVEGSRTAIQSYLLPFVVIHNASKCEREGIEKMADNKGYIKLWRNLQEWEWIDDPNTTYLWIMILLNVNWQDKTWKGVKIPKGSMFTSIEQLSKLCRQTKRQTRTALNHLISTNHLTSQPTNRGTLITVVNWDSWQEYTSESDTPSDTPSDKQSDTPSDTPSDNNQRIKEYKNTKNTKNQPPIKAEKPIKVDGGTMTRKQINGLVDPVFMDSIYDRFGDNGGSMLDDCISDITAKGRVVADFKNYVIGYMENHKDDIRIDDLWS